MGKKKLALGILAVGLIAAGVTLLIFRPWAQRIVVRILAVETVASDADHVRVDLTTDVDPLALAGGFTARVVYLRYSVDDNKPVELKTPHKYSEKDFEAITFRRPFFASFESGKPTDGGFITRWSIRLTDETHISPAIYRYSLADGAQHRITFEIYGADYAGGYVSSNPVTITFPEPKR